MPPQPGEHRSKEKPAKRDPLDDLFNKKEPKEKERNSKGKVDKNDKKDKKQKSSKGEKDSKPRSGSGPTRRHSPNQAGQLESLPPSKSNPDLRALQAKALAEKEANADGVGKSGKAAKKKAKGDRMGWWWWTKLVGGLIFVAGYGCGVVYLTFEVIKAKATATGDADIPACKRLQCPSDSVCVDHTGRGHAVCSENSYQNLQILQLVLGIVVGVPSVICLPCTVQWVVRTGGPLLCSKYTEKRRKMRVGGVERASRRSATSEVTADDDLEPGELQELTVEGKKSSNQKVGLFARLLGRGRKAETADFSDSAAGSASVEGGSSAAADAKPAGAEAADDDMDIFFAPTQKKKKDKDDGAGGGDGDDFLDSIFASRRNVNDAPPLPPPGDDGLAPPDEDLGRNKDPGLDDLFAKPVEQKKNVKGSMPARGGSPNKMPGGDIVPDEENFDDFFHRPARPAPGRGALPPVPNTDPGRGGGNAMPSMPSSAPARQRAPDDVSRTEFSAGLSAIFASAKAGPGSRMSAASKRSKPPDSMASSQQESEYEDDEEEYDEDQDYEAPDFIGFALGIARATARVDEDQSVAGGTDIFASSVGGWDDNRSDASGASAVDSLAGLEETLFSELFHPPL